MSASDDFKKQLGTQLIGALGSEFKFFKSRLELQRKFKHGHQSVVLSGSSKWSPFIHVAFHFGVCFDSARRVEKSLKNEHLAYYHIGYYSVNGPQKMGGLQYDGPGHFDVDLTAPPVDLVDRLRDAIVGMAYPFFERFEEMRTARDALVGRDPWCFGGLHAWRDILWLDAALEDLDHFREWCESLPPFEKDQAMRELARLS